MAGIKHAFSSGKADDADATLVNPSDWNAEHSPNLTTKGDIIVQEATNAVRLPVGSDGEALVAKASEASGINWEAVILASLLTTRGDIIFRNATVPARLAKGTSGYVLKQGANDPEWAIDPALDLVTTAGDILQATAADVLARLAIGTKTQLLAVNAAATALEYVQPGVSILDRDLDQVTVSNTTTETSIYSFSIPANTLGATGGIRLSLGGDGLNNDPLGTGTLKVRVKLGGVTVLVTEAMDLTNSADAFKLALQVWLLNSATGAQKWSAKLDINTGPASFTASLGDAVFAFHAVGHVSSSIDTTSAQTLDITVEWSAASTNHSLSKELAVLELLPAA